MKPSVLFSTSPQPVILAGILLYAQLAFAASCDLPMFAGARLFPTANDSRTVVAQDFNKDGFTDLAVVNNSLAASASGN